MTYYAITGLPTVGQEDNGIVQIDWHIAGVGATPDAALAHGRSRIGGEREIAKTDEWDFYHTTLHGNLRAVRREELRTYGLVVPDA